MISSMKQPIRYHQPSVLAFVRYVGEWFCMHMSETRTLQYGLLYIIINSVWAGVLARETETEKVCISVKPQSHQACDQVTTYLRPKNGPIVERTYDWWQRSWVIARGKSVATRS